MSISERTTIARAHPGDAVALTAIACAAKAHWGYPARWLEGWREGLSLTPPFIEGNDTFKAIRDGRIIGFHALREVAATWRLEHLWVEPEWMGRGVGRALFQHAVTQAVARGARCLTIESDPHAEAFYRHMGAERVGILRREIEGRPRELPLLRLDLSRPARFSP